MMGRCNVYERQKGRRQNWSKKALDCVVDIIPVTGKQCRGRPGHTEHHCTADVMFQPAWYIAKVFFFGRVSHQEKIARP
jgi:hypothetical protein